MKSFHKLALLAALLTANLAAHAAWAASAQADEPEAVAENDQAELASSDAEADEGTPEDPPSAEAGASADEPASADSSADRDLFALDLDPPSARTLQWSGRIGGGFGARRVEGERKFISEIHLRADFLWGKPGDRAVRYGAAVEIRSANLSTIEGAAGGALLIPTHPGWPLQLTAMVGYAGRFRAFGEHSDHAPIFVGTAAFGYRSYNFHSRYGYAINLFASTRTDLVGRGFEVTGGIELDLAFVTVIPVRMIKMAKNKSDPDEPEDEDGDYYED